MVLNWILAANSPQSLLVMKCPGGHYRQIQMISCFMTEKRGKWDCWDMSGVLSWFDLQLIWALMYYYWVKAGESFMERWWSCGGERGDANWLYILVHSYTQFNPLTHVSCVLECNWMNVKWVLKLSTHLTYFTWTFYYIMSTFPFDTLSHFCS